MLSRYEAVLLALDAGVVVHGADTSIWEANQRARDILGLQDLEGRLATDPRWQFLEADHSPMALERFPVVQVVTSGEAVRGLILIIREPEGLDVWVEVHALPVFDDAGTLDHVVVTFSDISQRRRAQEALAESERLYRMLSENSDGAVLLVAPGGGVAWVSPSFERLLGYSPAEAMALGGADLVHPDDLDVARAAVSPSGARASTVQVRFRRKDGQYRWMAATSRPVIDPNGTVTGRIDTLRDIHTEVLAVQELAASEEESRLAFDRSSVATCLVSNEGMLVRVNPAICQLMGRSEAELLSLGFLELTHPDDVTLGMDLVRDLLAGLRPSFRVTKRYVTGDGRVIWGDVTVSAVLDADGAIRHRIAQIIDVTAEHTLRESLLEAQRIAHVGSWAIDLASGSVTGSAELAAMLGLDHATPLDPSALAASFTPESWERLITGIAGTVGTGVPFELEAQTIRSGGAHGWMLVRGEAMRDVAGTTVGLQGTVLDVTERKVASDALQVLATHDPLTGLANRAALLDEITRALSAGRRSGHVTAVLMMDLDRFKNVNDTLGHGAGDDLLVAAAQRLAIVVRAGDLVARLGGDEFVVVMRDLEGPGEAIRAAGRLVEAFRSSFTPGGAELYTTASVGVAVATESSDAADLLREADSAMYAAKGQGRDRVSMFNEDLRADANARLSVEVDLRRALERDELSIWYQPEVELATGAVIAVEALLRWHHPDGTVWTADRFIDVAEDTGLILSIGDWVLQRACADAAVWAAARPDRPITVRVNVSALQLAEAGLLGAIDAALTASGLDPALLCIEITETALLRQTATAGENLTGIRDRGCDIALDDFGTGYASLTYLRQYPVDLLKIDRSFITRITTDDHDRQITAAIIALARALDITVTAEGVEHTEQAALLRQLGCPGAQGWLYSRAVPPEDVTPLLDHSYPTG